jgi:hypothetical protein
VFVKLHTHGAIERDVDALFGEKALAMHRVLNDRYNDGRRFRLHYVTAREAYNIAKAAEHGYAGDPSAYRDFRIAPYVASRYSIDAPHRPLRCSPLRLTVDQIDARPSATINFRSGPVSRLSGPFRALDFNRANDELTLGDCQSGSIFTLEPAHGFACAEITGGAISPGTNDGSTGSTSIIATTAKMTFRFERKSSADAAGMLPGRTPDPFTP